MKFMVQIGQEDVFFENDNPSIRYAIVVRTWGQGVVVRGYENKVGAKRGLQYQLDKFDKQGVGAMGSFYPAQKV